MKRLLQSIFSKSEESTTPKQNDALVINDPSLKAVARDAFISRSLEKYMIEQMAAAELKADSKRIGGDLAHMFSQGYEDAVIAQIFSRIGEGTKTFLEIGCGDGAQNCTRYLHTLGWKGVWIDGDPKSIASARKGMAHAVEDGSLEILEAFVTAENINDLVDGTMLRDQEIDFISIDIDRNTSHIWRALKTKSRVACIEVNGNLPPSLPYEVPYVADKTFTGTTFFGASLKSLELIGRDKNMSLVGSDIHGLNGFFVANDQLGDKFCEPYTAENHYRPLLMKAIGVRAHRHMRYHEDEK